MEIYTVKDDTIELSKKLTHKDIAFISDGKVGYIWKGKNATDLDELNETDIRRSIQNLLEQIIDSVGEKLGPKFIEDFKRSLESFYLLRIEEMGVNLHLIQLRHQMKG